MRDHIMKNDFVLIPIKPLAGFNATCILQNSPRHLKKVENTLLNEVVKVLHIDNSIVKSLNTQ